MAVILITYHSQTGNTEKMAQTVARGAQEVEGATVLLKCACDTTAQDLKACDGLIIGSPEYFGYMAGAVKDLFDRTYQSLEGHPQIVRKPLGIFICAGNDGSGALRHLERIAKGYRFKKVQEPIVCQGPVTEAILARCAELGKTIAAGCKEGIF